MKWYLNCFKQYANFDDRASRKEFWMFVLLNFMFMIVAVALDQILDTSHPEAGLGVVFGLYTLLIMTPGLAVSVRRLHDIGKSGWMIFIILIPLVGAIWFFVLALKEGNQGENNYGINPKNHKLFS